MCFRCEIYTGAKSVSRAQLGPGSTESPVTTCECWRGSVEPYWPASFEDALEEVVAPDSGRQSNRAVAASTAEIV